MRAALALLAGLALASSIYAQSGSGKKEGSPQPSPPPKPEIIDRPLTPGTGTYIEHGAGIPLAPSPQPEKKK